MVTSSWEALCIVDVRSGPVDARSLCRRADLRAQSAGPADCHGDSSSRGIAPCLRLPDRARLRPSEVFALLAGAILVVAVLGHLFGIEALYGVPAHPPHTRMALPSAVVLLALSSGTLAARPDTGLMSIITAEDLGGAAVRRLLWSLFVLPPVAVAVVLGARRGLVFDVLCVCVPNLLLAGRRGCSHSAHR